MQTALLVGGLGLAIVGAASVIWQMRSGTQRYQTTFGGNVEWADLQRDQRRTAWLVIASLFAQLMAVYVAVQADEAKPASPKTEQQIKDERQQELDVACLAGGGELLGVYTHTCKHS
jgi:hypothetical protein